ncbi:MAG: DUF3343 domain-containing protein [Ruminococcaceae bacterium]|nr:DUF3343 domain-containing protein [Oscillospiraceae bacterium]
MAERVAKLQRFAYYVAWGRREIKIKEGESVDYALVVFNSVTVSNRAKKLCKKHIDYAAVIQLPVEFGIRGCSYGLRIKKSDYNTVLEIAREYELLIRDAFIEKNIDGQKVYEKI